MSRVTVTPPRVSRAAAMIYGAWRLLQHVIHTLRYWRLWRNSCPVFGRQVLLQATHPVRHRHSPVPPAKVGHVNIALELTHVHTPKVFQQINYFAKRNTLCVWKAREIRKINGSCWPRKPRRKALRRIALRVVAASTTTVPASVRKPSTKTIVVV